MYKLRKQNKGYLSVIPNLFCGKAPGKQEDQPSSLSFPRLRREEKIERKTKIQW